MAYQSNCGIPKTATSNAKSGAPTSRVDQRTLRSNIPDALKRGRNTYDHYSSRCPLGIPAVATNYYEERIMSHYTTDGVVNMNKIRLEKWSAAQQLEYSTRLCNNRRLFDENIRMFIPKGLEVLYLIRKGMPKNKILPWPHQQVTRSSGVTTRSTSSTAPLNVDIFADFERDVTYGNDIFKDMEFPPYDRVEIGFSDEIIGTPVTLLIEEADTCTAPITNQPARKFNPDMPENTYEDRDDVFLFGRPADCKQHRIRASDVQNRHPTTVKSVTIMVNAEVATLESEDSCKCVDCITARINESDRNAREIEGAYSREELFEFAKTQSWNTIVFAPNASGKTTTRALLRARGIACFDIGAKVDWYCHGPHLRNSIMFCTDPVYLKFAKNPIAIIPSEGERRRRYDFRLRTRPELRWKANLNFPVHTRVIHSNKMLSDVIQIMQKNAD